MRLLSDDPIQRRLLAGAAALLALLAFTAATFALRGAMTGWMTPLGLVAPFDLLAVGVSMGLGGAIARHGFRGWAVVLVVLMGAASAIAAYGFAPATLDGAAHWLLRNTVLQVLLSALVAWLGADAGQRLAVRRARSVEVSDRA